MKIIILGAGQVGSTLTEQLCNDNDVTIVDIDPERLHALQERFDVRTVCGPASYPNILMSAGAEDADLLIAVTHSDEANMIACQVAYNLFRTPTKIARIRAMQYAVHEELFGSDGLAVDVLISPENLVMQHIKRLIEHPDALQIVNFAQGRVQLAGVQAYYGGPLVGQPVTAMQENHPDAKILAVFRNNIPLPINEETMIEPNDEIFYLATPAEMDNVIRSLRELGDHYKRIMIAGGGNIGAKLAQALENHYQVKLIESAPLRAQMLANDLNTTIVLQGDAADRELLLDENVEDTDIFCAVTNKDETNIMSAILAKRLGADKVMALINRTAFVEIVEGSDIDIAISPQQSTIGSLLTHIRRADVVTVHSLRKGAAEALETIAHGDPQTSLVVGKKIKDIRLPRGATIGALVRGEHVIMAYDDCEIAPEDHVIVFVLDKKSIPEIERLFQVGFAFI